ncbi:MAG: DUF2949 domain-containing protein [Oscillatoriales cyanobacterium SM2_3_0]|nr:DUF2949 domain-containing protein [Oscillatoriales cyanobacterium SM2_3_0]
MKGNRHDNHILQFLQEELLISTSEIAVALRHFERSGGSLPMVLYQYGFVTIEQLSRIFDWQNIRCQFARFQPRLGLAETYLSAVNLYYLFFILRKSPCLMF